MKNNYFKNSCPLTRSKTNFGGGPSKKCPSFFISNFLFGGCSLKEKRKCLQIFRKKYLFQCDFFLNFAFLCENKTNPCPLQRQCLRQCVTKHKSVKGTVSQKCNVVQQWQIRRRKTKYFGGYLRFYRHLKFLPQKIPRIFSDFVTVYEHCNSHGKN